MAKRKKHPEPSQETLVGWQERLKAGSPRKIDHEALKQARKNIEQLTQEHINENERRKKTGLPSRADELRAEQERLMDERFGKNR